MATVEPASRIDEIEARLAAATPGEWSVLREQDDDFVSITLLGPKNQKGADWIWDDLERSPQQEDDLTFIAAAPADVRWLIDCVRELEEQWRASQLECDD